MPTPRSHGPRHPEVPTSDPLADLRAQAIADGNMDRQHAIGLLTPLALDGPTGNLPGGVSGVFDQAWHDDAATAVVTGWHADLVATRSLHRGGTCSCRYLAAAALRTAVGVALPEAVEGEGERDGGD